MPPFGKIDIVTKMFRAMPFRGSNATGPTKTPTVYRIERVFNADQIRVIYGFEIARAVNVSRMHLESDFGKAMSDLARSIQSDAKNYQGNTIHVQEEEPDIEFECSL
jgi:hypothetical protein